MSGQRKVWIAFAGLLTLLGFGVMSAYAGLAQAGIETLTWGTVALCTAAIGGNAAEHFARRPAGSAAKHAAQLTAIEVAGKETADKLDALDALTRKAGG